MNPRICRLLAIAVFVCCFFGSPQTLAQNAYITNFTTPGTVSVIDTVTNMVTPFITLVLLSVATACFFTRGTGRMRHVPASDVMPAYDWRTFVPGRRGIGSRLTQRWRKADSNRWSPLEK